MLRICGCHLKIFGINIKNIDSNELQEAILYNIILITTIFFCGSLVTCNLIKKCINQIFVEFFFNTICFLSGKLFIKILTICKYPSKDQEQMNKSLISLLGLVIFIFLIYELF